MNTSLVWSKEKAWEWHRNMPWLRGCNYLPSDCCNRIEFWQSLHFEKHLATVEREFALMESIGFNSVRVIFELIVYEQEKESFSERFERFLSIAAAHHITVMVCFGNDCTVPKNSGYREPHLGVQEYDLGYHGGRKNSPHGSNPGAIGYSLLDEPEHAESFFGMVREFVTRYAHDPRICVWDLFNEPGNNNRGELSLPHVRRVFETARACAPAQPLTSGLWCDPLNPNPAEKAAGELSDVISYHCYGNYQENIRRIALFRRLGRPMLNTEWLHRPFHDTVELMFPLFYLEGIGCWNWGFVAGLSQTYEPWEGMWKAYENGDRTIDFSRWQHDLFRPSLRPYDPAEIDVIRAFCSLADADEKADSISER